MKKSRTFAEEQEAQERFNREVEENERILAEEQAADLESDRDYEERWLTNSGEDSTPN